MPALQNSNFIVFGPGGRCGSHWVCTLIKNIFTPAIQLAEHTFFATGWIFHTNGLTDLLEMPSELRNSTTLIYCVRHNYFDTVISFLVAEITNEWHLYTSKSVEPFVVDPVRFQTLIDDLQYYHTTIKRNILPLFNNLITIEFDTLINSDIPLKYVADQLGIDHDRNYQQSNSILSNKNTRNYKELILNWTELVTIYEIFLMKRHTHK